MKKWKKNLFEKIGWICQLFSLFFHRTISAGKSLLGHTVDILQSLIFDPDSKLNVSSTEGPGIFIWSEKKEILARAGMVLFQLCFDIFYLQVYFL